MDDFRMPDLGSLMQAAEQMQREIARVQEELGRTQVEASSGGGMVTVVANGRQEILSVKIDRAVVDASELDTRLIMRPLRNTERVMNNSAVERLLTIEREKGTELTIQDIIPQIAGVYPKVMHDGDLEAGAWSCGMVAGLIDDIPTCKELLVRIMKQAEALIRERLTGMLDR